MSIVDDLLQALNIPQLQLFTAAVPADDSQLVTDLTAMLADACGQTLGEDAKAHTRDVVAAMVAQVGPTFGPGANPVTTAILASDPGATYGHLVRSAVGATGGRALRPAVVATEGAAEILAELEAAGIAWGQPDQTRHPTPLAAGPDPSPPVATTAPTTTPASFSAANTASLRATVAGVATVAAAQSWKDEVKKIVNKIKEAVGGSGTGSNFTRGQEAHLILQAQFAEGAFQQAPTHLVVVDNKVPNPVVPLPWPQDLPAVKTWFRNAAWLSDLQVGSPSYNRFEPVIDALGTGRRQQSAYFWPKPDILDVETRRLWEIKAVDSWEEGVDDLVYYTSLLNLQVFSQSAIDTVIASMVNGTPTAVIPDGFWLPGRPWVPYPFLFRLSDGNGAIAFPAGPGLILYQVISADLYKALSAVLSASVVMLLMMMLHLQLLKANVNAAAGRSAALAAAAAAAVAAAAVTATPYVEEVLLVIAASLLPDP